MMSGVFAEGYLYADSHSAGWGSPGFPRRLELVYCVAARHAGGGSVRLSPPSRNNGNCHPKKLFGTM